MIKKKKNHDKVIFLNHGCSWDVNWTRLGKRKKKKKKNKEKIAIAAEPTWSCNKKFQLHM